MSTVLTPAPALPAGCDGRTTSRLALAVLAAVPDDDWRNSWQIGLTCFDLGVPVTVTAESMVPLGADEPLDPARHILYVDGTPIARVLRQLRRHGWVVYDRFADLPRYQRTPTGSTVTCRHPSTYT